MRTRHTQDDLAVMNFLVTGQIRCGASVIQTSVQSHSDATCHVNLLGEKDKVRRESHEDYFGAQSDDDAPDWYVPTLTSPEAYLTTKILRKRLHDESAIGVCLLYPELRKHDLWEFFHERYCVGDFGMIHVTRNPLACFVSRKQAEDSGIWHQDINDRQLVAQPSPVQIDVAELTAFCRWHAAAESKVRAMCSDSLEIEYRELFLDYHNVMSAVFDFLELPQKRNVCPGVRRLKNRSIADRIVNFEEAKQQAPHDVKEYFDTDNLF